jgi:hypothetical protein
MLKAAVAKAYLMAKKWRRNASKGESENHRNEIIEKA